MTNINDNVLFLTRCLLLRDRCAPRAFTSACVCVRSLTAHRQSTTMTQATITTDVHQTLDVHLDALAQIAFDLALRFEDGANPAQLVFTQDP